MIMLCLYLAEISRRQEVFVVLQIRVGHVVHVILPRPVVVHPDLGADI